MPLPMSGLVKTDPMDAGWGVPGPPAPPQPACYESALSVKVAWRARLPWSPRPCGPA